MPEIDMRISRYEQNTLQYSLHTTIDLAHGKRNILAAQTY